MALGRGTPERGRCSLDPLALLSALLAGFHSTRSSTQLRMLACSACGNLLPLTPAAASDSSPAAFVLAIMVSDGRGVLARFGFLVSKSTDYGPRVREA